MAEVNQSSCESITSPVNLISVPQSLPSKSTNLSTTSSGVCLSLEDPFLVDSQGDGFHRSLLNLSSPTPDPSLFGSLYSGASQTAEAESSEAENPLAEIELVSLIAKRPLPQYRLRVDPCTAFVGYNNRDFSGARRATRRLKSILPLSPCGLTTIPSTDNLNNSGETSAGLSSGPPLESEQTDVEEEVDNRNNNNDDEDDDSISLSSQQIESILDYFLLCGLRVSQMTHTYEDLEAITHLLEEKQNDLELAAKIGKNLLDKNHELEQRLSDAEKKLIATEDTISQLKHDLRIRDNLLQIYSRDHQDDDQTSISSGWLSPGPALASDSGEGLSLASVNFNHLNQKLRDLEEENYVLREERNRLTEKADLLDEHENNLVRDCARQLTTAKRDISTLLDALTKKSDAFLNQQSEVTRLLTRGLDLENRVKQLAAENEMLVNRLQESQAAQQRLTTELGQMRDKYDECLSLFHEARAEVRLLRKRSRRANLRSGYTLSQSPGMVAVNSTPSSALGLQPSCSSRVGTVLSPRLPEFSDESSSSLDMSNSAEPNNQSLASDLARTAAQDCAADNVNRLFRAMDQARQVHEQTGDTMVPSKASHRTAECYPEDTVSSSGFFSGSGHWHHPEPFDKPSGSFSNAQGIDASHRIPTADSNDAFSSYNMARANEDLFKRHSWFGSQSARDTLQNSNRSALFHHNGLALQNSLDDSLLTGPVPSSDPSTMYSQSYAKLPQRLKLIKPLDGSEVLQHWQRLATPSFTRALFDAPLPGVRGRAGVNIETDRRAVSVGAAPTGLQKMTGSFRSGGSRPKKTDTTENLSHEDQCRFGASLPSHLIGDGIRSRSLEHLQAGTRKFRGSALNSCSMGHHMALGDSVDRFDWISRTEGTGPGSPFSITSLVSALLPFSLNPTNQPSQNSHLPEHLSRYAPTKNACGINPPEAEPIRIRPRSPARSRGLLEVSQIGSEVNSVQRVVTSTVRSNSPPTVLPNPQPPPVSISAHTFVKPAYSRTVRNTNLSEITEESGSPPKLLEATAEVVTRANTTTSECTDVN